MKKYTKIFLLSLSVFSTVFLTKTMADDYCTKEILGNTPAASGNACALHTFHKTADDKCFVQYHNCKIKVFNPATNQMLDAIVTTQGTFPNHQNLSDLRIDIKYNVQWNLAMKKPTS